MEVWIFCFSKRKQRKILRNVKNKVFGDLESMRHSMNCFFCHFNNPWICQLTAEWRMPTV